MNFFVKYFIGESENADRCKIINPKSLFFNKTKEEFDAKASEIIKIENYGLGYLLKFKIENYTFYFNENRINYKGYVSFDTLIPKNQKQMQQWIKNRRKAYLGSITHFMRMLSERKLIEEGFFLRRIVSRHNLKGEEKKIGLLGDTIVTVPKLLDRKNIDIQTISYKRMIDTTKFDSLKTVLNFKNTLEITYIKEEEPYKYIRDRGQEGINYARLPQRSMIQLLKPEVTVMDDGQYFPADGIHFSGYWSWELITEELPFDYEPDT